MHFSSHLNGLFLPVFIEAVLYGIFSLMFMKSSSIIWHEHRHPSTPRARRATNIKLFIVSMTMFIVASVHLSTTMLGTLALDERTYVVFLVSQLATYGIQTFVSDGFMLYRARVLWSHRRWVCLPIYGLFASTIATGIGTLYQLLLDGVKGRDRFNINNPWVISFFFLTLITNACATALIVARLWSIRRQIQSMPDHKRDSNYRRASSAVVIVLESGAVYLISLILYIVFYMSLPSGVPLPIIRNAMPQILAIIFTLMIVRVSRGVAQGQQFEK